MAEKIKYFKIELFKGVAGDEPPFVVGYSATEPRLDIPGTEFVRLSASPSDAETFSIKRSMIGFVKVTPVLAS
ncbi:hypothetical protein V5K00_RS10390 [Enterobacter asburiae]